MNGILILLSSIIVVLLILLFVFVRAGMKASRLLQDYEIFYINTLEDVNSVLSMLDVLTNRRQFLTDDPDVQNFHRITVILRDILLGYRNAKKEKERQEKEKLLQ